MTNDLVLRETITQELAFEPSVDVSKIAVTVREGVVALSGTVSAYAEKIAAEQAVHRIPGIRGLRSDITIDLPPTHQRNDVDIASAVLSVLSWNVSVPPDAIKVYVEKGWVTLDGAVEWQYQREHAETLVRNLFGVLGVSNRIVVKPYVQIAEIGSLGKVFHLV